MIYAPDKWIVIKITHNDTIAYKLFTTTGGGYLYGDSWRMNSGIEQMIDKGRTIDVKGFSGSIYSCGKGSYGLSAYGGGVLSGFINAVPSDVKIEVLDETYVLEFLSKELS